ncbi:DM13 domain-containing protein [Moorena producens JHB]|uniref:DM13 domain-containing protein n=1 Tax=Moorena producens (strain JHB) TaxID=1454205 RepID=A0A9Q9UWR2_MOOP1|nr:DM13 domain-containing protein [Moorena producens]WAN70126.1 DM13 domain-containing protein [Moorena producens JHB]
MCKGYPIPATDGEVQESLGRLQQVSGTQRYRIPADVNPEDFSSLVIWCRKFNVTLAFRPRVRVWLRHP